MTTIESIVEKFMTGAGSTVKHVNARLLALLMIVALLLWVPLADAPFSDDDGLTDVPFTAGDDVTGNDPVSEPGQQDAVNVTADLPAPVWPKAARTTASSSTILRSVAGTPISLRSPQPADVVVHGQDVVRELGLNGVVVDLAPDRDTNVEIMVDYSDFQHGRCFRLSMKSQEARRWVTGYK